MQSISLRSIFNYVLHLLLPSMLLPAHERLEVILSFGGKRKCNSPVAICTDIQELSFCGAQQPQLGLENSVVRVPQVGHDGVRIGCGLCDLSLVVVGYDERISPVTLTCAHLALFSSSKPNAELFLLVVCRLAPKSKFIQTYNTQDRGFCHFNCQEYA